MAIYTVKTEQVVMFTTLCCEHHYLLCGVHYCATDITTQFLQCTIAFRGHFCLSGAAVFVN